MKPSVIELPADRDVRLAVEEREVARAARKTLNLARYRRRYAQHKPAPAPKVRVERRHTLGTERPFALDAFAPIPVLQLRRAAGTALAKVKAVAEAFRGQ